MSLTDWLHDPERVLLGTSQAIERARARGAESIEPDDLMAGMLLAVSRFGIVDLRDRVLDLAILDLRFDLPSAEVALKLPYSRAAAAVFDRASRVAREDGGARLAPIHLLVALGEHSVPTFSMIAVRYGVDPTGWRRLLAAITPPPRANIARDPALSRPTDPTGADPGGLLTPEEAAHLLGVQLQTLRAHVRGGKVPAFRAGERAIRIRREDLAALLAIQRGSSQRTEPVAAPRDDRTTGKGAFE
jgi:excisionase family DNA binding protein